MLKSEYDLMVMAEQSFIMNYREPVDPWPGQAQILGGPHDGKFFKIEGFSLVYAKQNENYKWYNPVDMTDSVEALACMPYTTVVCEYQRYTWWEYFQFEWFFVPIEVFIRTFAIDPALKEEL